MSADGAAWVAEVLADPQSQHRGCALRFQSLLTDLEVAIEERDANYATIQTLYRHMSQEAKRMKAAERELEELRARASVVPEDLAPLTRMSKAIRETIQHYAPTFKELPDEVLKDFLQIASAYVGDMKDEMERRWPKPPENDYWNDSEAAKYE